ncbi:Arginyl-tRNA synthetase [Sergentomyia squamirostris]
MLVKISPAISLHRIVKKFSSSLTCLRKFSAKESSSGNIIVEYSSPNIAKPFHMGHLRSTIIGNFIANLFADNNHSVVRINYLGDWGTQFGYLKLGVDLLKLTDEELQRDSIKQLYRAYVAANQEGKKNEQIATRAREIFSRMELEDTEDLTKWNLYRDYTVEELKRVYSRLGVHFDHYHWESMYRRKNIEGVLENLRQKGILHRDDDGKETIHMGDRRVAVVKSDGTTLYLARDIAAIQDRVKKYNFSHLYYIVDTAQNDHFKILFNVSKDLGLNQGLSHVQFGRIHGMSTRKGSVVFLEDILNEAKEIMREKQLKCPTTKIDLETDEKTADVLGVSAVIINELKKRRLKDYTFDWKHALQSDGDTGYKLQYTHCKLFSLAENAGVEAAKSLNPDLLPYTLCQDIVEEIDRLPDVLEKCRENLEAYLLVKYLFKLCHTINRCMKTARVKQEPNVELQQQRLLIFNRAKETLARGMNILGLTPLNRM